VSPRSGAFSPLTPLALWRDEAGEAGRALDDGVVPPAPAVGVGDGGNAEEASAR
jgi:hypothetical protein